MKFKFWSLVASVMTLVFVYGTSSSTQDEPIWVLSSYLVPYEYEARMPLVAEHFEVTHREAAGFEVIVPRQRRQEFLSWVPKAQLLQEDISAEVRGMEFNPFGRKYRNFEGVLEELQNLQERFPDLVQVLEYGRSERDRPLVAIKISDNVQIDEDEPELMLTAATHGDEIITTEILMDLIYEILDKRNEARFQAMIQDHELYFIPVFNPDGYVKKTRYDNNRDPNRSYPYPGKTKANPTGSVQGALDFFHSRNFVGTLDVHASGRLIMYPWAYTYDELPPEKAIGHHELAASMAGVNTYTYGQISKVIYVAKGSSADYYHWSIGTVAMAVEVGRSKAPPPSQISGYVEELAESTWRFIEAF